MIFSHHDADGVASAVLLKKAESFNDDVWFPEEFGATTMGNTQASIMLDMRPNDPNWDGLCIDHHPDHPEQRNYDLIWDSKPATLIVYEKYKSAIPEEEAWKVVVGVCGDGQPELIPSEVWKKFPSLRYKRTLQFRGGNFSQFPLYKLLSSLVNSACRINKAEVAFTELLNAKSPMQLFNSEILNKCKEDVKRAYNKIISEAIMMQQGDILLVEYYDDYRMEGYVASSVYTSGTVDALCVIAHNLQSGAFSIRGDLTNLVMELLREQGIETGGHAGFAGGNHDKSMIDLLHELSSSW